MIMWQGKMSNALFIYKVINMVQDEGLGRLKPSSYVLIMFGAENSGSFNGYT